MFARKATDLDQQLARAHAVQGTILCDRKKDYDAAIVAFQRAIAIEPSEAEHQFNLGMAQRLKGHEKEAITSFREATRLKPTYGRAFSHLAKSLLFCADPRLQNPIEALAAAKRGAELEPQSEHAWFVLGYANYRAGEGKAGIAAIEKAMSLLKTNQTGSARHWFVLAMAHWQLDDKEEARRWYDKAVRWIEKQPSPNEELQRIQDEAAKLVQK